MYDFGVRLSMARKPKYRKHTARNLGFVEFNSRRIYLPGAYKSPESLAAYRDFLKRNVEPFQLPPQPLTAPATLGVIVARYLAWAEDNYPMGSRSENANIHATMQLLLSVVDPMLPAAEFGPSKFKAFQAALAKRKLARSYINATCGRIKRMFKWAASEELVDQSVYFALTTVAGLRKGRSPAGEPAKRAPVAWEHVEAILPELSPTVRAMVMTQWLTGARSQSVCQARPEQFDRSKKPWEWSPRHKQEHTTDELVLYVGPKAQKILAPFLKGKGPKDYLFQPKHLSGKRAKGFRSFYDSTSYLRAVARAIARTNRNLEEIGEKPIPYWTPHQIRHARGTLVRARHGLEAAQASLGHARLDSAQLYAKRQAELARRVALDMG